MTTVHDIPAYLRRCPEEHEKKHMEHDLRDHAIGYADLATKLTSVRLRQSALLVEDISTRKLLHADPAKANDLLIEARRQLREEANQISRLIDHIKDTLTTPPPDVES